MHSGNNIPFPSTEDALEDRVMEERASLNPSPEPLVLISPSSESGSNATTSSKSTSSDKLSALPPLNIPTPTSTSRRPRSSSLTMSNMKRGYHHSLSASSSPIRGLESDSQGVGHKTPNANLHLGDPRQGSPENASSGKVTPQQRVSFESDRHSLPTVRQAISHILRGGEPHTSSPPMHSSPFAEHREEQSSNSNNQQHFGSHSPSQSRSRATSPLRMLRDLSARLHLGRTAPEERFVPVDPFRSKIGFPFCGLRSRHDKQHDLENGGGSDSSGAYDCDDLLPVNSIKSWGRDARIFFMDTLPRELYLNFLLRLPAMYFSRVARIFEDADVSRPDIQRMINNSGGAGGAMPTAPQAGDPNASPFLQDSMRGRLSPGAVPAAAVGAATSISMTHMPLPFPDEWSPPLVSPALVRFKHSWEDFIESLLREWKTLNLVSALLASAILTVFQIPQAANDPITRTFALLSLICSLMSLSYGCIYIVRFGTMRSMFHASRWAEEARETKTSIWWNVWVLLATPAVWMAWSMLLFVSAILSFVWRTGSVLDPPVRNPLGARAALGPRITITGVFVLGLVYLGMIVRTLRNYGPYQHSSRALPPSGAGMETRNEFGKAVNDTEANSARRPRARDIDAAMERRGRERKRSVSSLVRRREEAVGRGGGSADSGFEDLKVPKFASRGLGLGSRATTPRGELGMEIEMDLKVPWDVSVKKVP